MKNPEYDKEERDIVESFERGEWKSVPNVKHEIEKHRQYARNTLRKDRRVNIRISSSDLEVLRAIAVEDGIPYQTMIASILHRYANGRLIDKPRTGRTLPVSR